MRALDLAWWRLSNMQGSTKMKITNSGVAIIRVRDVEQGILWTPFFFDCRKEDVEVVKR